MLRHKMTFILPVPWNAKVMELHLKLYIKSHSVHSKTNEDDENPKLNQETWLCRTQIEDYGGNIVPFILTERDKKRTGTDKNLQKTDILKQKRTKTDRKRQ